MSSTPIDWSPNDASLLALLVAGHMLADFVLQPWRMVVRKRTSLGWLFAHGAVVLGAHGLLLAPFYFGGGRALALAAAIALTHVVIDRAKIGAERRFGRRLGVFGLDQAAHLAVILAAWSLLRSAGLVPAPGPLCLDPEILGQGAICLSAFAFVINGGSATVAGVLRILGGTAPKGEEDSGAPHAGHLIGILERLVILPLPGTDNGLRSASCSRPSPWRASRIWSNEPSPRPIWSGP